MSLPIRIHDYTYAEYVALEEHSPVRHEFIAGEIYAMAGGTPEHAALASAILRLLGNQLPAGCRTYTSDLRVRIPAREITTYPDGAVICGKSERAADDPMAVTNPVILIEVTSSSTATYDRGAKLEAYQALTSVREVLIVSHDAVRVALHRREDDGSWSTHEAGAGGTVFVTAVGATISVDEVYRDLD
jgi:Uma2 family endonuclease